MLRTFLLQNLLDAWLGLWQWVFQPAIGVLMLGAVSAAPGRGKGWPACVVHTWCDAAPSLAVGGTALRAWPDQAGGAPAQRWVDCSDCVLPVLHSGAWAACEQALAWAQLHSHHRLKPSIACLLLFTSATVHKPPDTWPPNPVQLVSGAVGWAKDNLGQGQR